MNVLWVCSEARALFYSAVVHCLIGGITGGIFPIQALLGLMAVALAESLVAMVAFGVPTGLWSLTNLVAIQVGYLGGIFVRSLLEKVGLAEPGRHVNHTS